MNDDLQPTPPPQISTSDAIKEAADPYYNPGNCDLIKIYARQLWFPETWADELGVDEYTMYRWIGKFTEFAEAYQVALTILKSEYSKKVVGAAIGLLPDANAHLLAVIGKTRFPESYTEPNRSLAPPPPKTPEPKGEMLDVTPASEGGSDDIASMNSDELLAELGKLKKRHGVCD